MGLTPAPSGPYRKSAQRIFSKGLIFQRGPRAKCRPRDFALAWNGHRVQGSPPWGGGDAAPRAAVGGEVFSEDVFFCGSVTETGFHGFLLCIRVNCSALSGRANVQGKWHLRRYGGFVGGHMS